MVQIQDNWCNNISTINIQHTNLQGPDHNGGQRNKRDTETFYREKKMLNQKHVIIKNQKYKCVRISSDFSSSEWKIEMLQSSVKELYETNSGSMGKKCCELTLSINKSECTGWRFIHVTILFYMCWTSVHSLSRFSFFFFFLEQKYFF